MNKCYIAGRIGEDEDKDRRIALFGYVENLLREAGYVPVNPTRTVVSRWRWLYRIVGYKLTLLYDLWLLLRCDNIYKIPGWEVSRGANIESCTAFHFHKYPIYPSCRENIDRQVRARAAEIGVKIEERGDRNYSGYSNYSGYRRFKNGRI